MFIHVNTFNRVHQVEEHMKILLEEGPCLGSAFMSAPESGLFTYVSDTQERLLRMLNTNRMEYSIIFTAGFQESFQVVAEAYPFQRGSPLLVCQDNHAAVRQVRNGSKPTPLYLSVLELMSVLYQ